MLKKAADAKSDGKLSIERAASIQISAEVGSIEGNKYGTALTGLGYNCSKVPQQKFFQLELKIYKFDFSRLL